VMLQSLRRSGGVLALAVAVAFTASAHAGSAPVKVKIDNFTFNSAEVTVPVGTTVTWVNQDDIPHTVVADDKKTFRSKVLDTDETFSFTFTTPGTFGYFCSIHPHMTGKVVVKAS
jgi:amicyanin